MKLEINIVDSISLPPDELADFRAFLQSMANRVCVGNLRYGTPAARKRYMTRLSKELKAYRKTGNAESLFNVAVYAWLETVAPEHRNQHWDEAADSVTRGEMRGNIA